MPRRSAAHSSSPRFRCVASFLALTLFASLAGAHSTHAPTDFDLAGDWQGTLSARGATLRIVFHFVSDDGDWSATMDSVDQGALGIPAAGVDFDEGRVTVAVPTIGGRYVGTVLADGTIDGTWSQGGARLDLDLERQITEIVLSRPQEPKEPFPYRSLEVRFSSDAEGVTLAGTLTVPEGDGPFPAVALVSGSGAQDRDSTLMGHRPFLVLADHLTRRGIVVLRYDDRGVGQSTGNFGTSTTEDFALDAAGAVALLDSRDDVASVGLVGHSEGGLIAPLVAVDSDLLDFAVLLAPPVLSGRRTLVEQGAETFERSGMGRDWIARHREIHDAVFEAVVTDAPDAELTSAIDALITHQTLGSGPTGEQRQAQIDGQKQALTSPWFRFFLVHDPVPVLAGVEQPILALFGAKDFQVDPALHEPALEAALDGHDQAEIETLDGLNHLFQTAETGLLDEYGKIEETFAPVALERISGWILATVEPADEPSPSDG
ncbi:MAG: alpha/beta fold hydrolase [Acidobacteriota bacterium]